LLVQVAWGRSARIWSCMVAGFLLLMVEDEENKWRLGGGGGLMSVSKWRWLSGSLKVGDEWKR
jgi:hypothetical protein